MKNTRAQDRRVSAVNQQTEDMRQLSQDMHRMVQNPRRVRAAVNQANMLVQRNERGFLAFTDQQIEKYRILAAKLSDAIGGETAISDRGAEDILQNFLFNSIFQDPENKVITTFDQRLESACVELKKIARNGEQDYMVHIEIDGIAQPDRPYRFGACTIRKMSQQFATREVQAAFDTATNLEWRKVLANHYSKTLGKSTRICIAVTAFDKYAAIQKSLEIVQDTVDIFNSTIALVMPGGRRPLAELSHNTRSKEVRIGVLGVKGQDGGLLIAPVVENNYPLQLPQLKYDHESKLLVTRASAIAKSLVTESSNEVIENLTLAMKLFGRARRARTWQESLLHSMIGMEVLAGQGGKTEITLRIKQRIALLVSDTPRMRMIIMKRVGDLYGIRSNLVHAGSSDGTRKSTSKAASKDSRNATKKDAELAEMYLNRAIWRMLMDSELRKIKCIVGLNKWFDERLMS